MTKSAAISVHKTMLRGGFAAAAPGLVAIVAATTAAPSTLSTHTGLSSIGIAALGVVFFCLAYLFAHNRYWAGLPGLICIAFAICVFSTKAARLLVRYYQFNPIQSFADLTAPFSVISLHLCLVIIAGSLGWLICKALLLSRSIGPAPVSKHVWGVMGIWLAIVIWQSVIPS